MIRFAKAVRQHNDHGGSSGIMALLDMRHGILQRETDVRATVGRCQTVDFRDDLIPGFLVLHTRERRSNVVA